MRVYPADSSRQGKEHSSRTASRDFHGAALIDENNREIPITEDMIVKALRLLEQEH